MKTSKIATISFAFAVLAAATTGCAGPAQTAKVAPIKAESNLLTGKVLEAMDSGGYTYLHLERPEGKVWVAAPIMKAAVGQEVKLLPGAEMPNFHSKTLNRTFETIVFSGGVPGATDGAVAVETKPAPADPYAEASEVIMVGKVVETMEAGAYSYLRVAKDDKAAWAAVPRTRLNVGDEVELQPGTPMGTFTSRSLGRTFKSIFFASGVKVTVKSPATLAAEAAEAAAEAKAAAEPPAPGEHPKVEGMKGAMPSNHPKLDGTPSQPAKAEEQPAQTPISGKVVETMVSGGYTYACLEKDGVKTWVAIPRTQVAVNQELTVAPGGVLNNFHSKTMNRTFEKIIFSSGPIK